MKKNYFNTLQFIEDNGLTASSFARKLGITTGAVYFYIRNGRISENALKRLKGIVPEQILKRYEMDKAVEVRKAKKALPTKPCKFIRLNPENEPIIRRDFISIPFAVNRLIDGYASIRPLLFTKYLPIIEVLRESIIPIGANPEKSIREFLSEKGIEHSEVSSEMILLIYYVFRS